MENPGTGTPTHPPETPPPCARTSTANLIFHIFTTECLLTRAGVNYCNGIADPPIVEYPRPGSYPSIASLVRAPVISSVPGRRP